MGIGQKVVCIEWNMKRKNELSEWILLSLGILLLLLLLAVKHRLDASQNVTKSSGKTEKTNDLAKETVEKMTQENALFLKNQREEGEKQEVDVKGIVECRSSKTPKKSVKAYQNEVIDYFR